MSFCTALSVEVSESQEWVLDFSAPDERSAVLERELAEAELRAEAAGAALVLDAADLRAGTLAAVFAAFLAAGAAVLTTVAAALAGGAAAFFLATVFGAVLAAGLLAALTGGLAAALGFAFAFTATLLFAVFVAIFALILPAFALAAGCEDFLAADFVVVFFFAGFAIRSFSS